MEFDQLRALLSVVEHGSFTRAAEALGLSQSTVSFQIKALEAAVGTKVVDRGRDGVQPTAAGSILLRYAQRMLALRREAAETLAAEASGLQGHVTVGASTIPGEYLLPDLLATLRATHPGVNVTIEVSDSGEAVAALVAGRCDLALVGGRPSDRRLVVRPFADDEVVLVGRPDLVAAAGTDPALLCEASLVLRKETSGTREAVAGLLAKHPPQGARVVVGSTEAAKRCALAGLGLAFSSRCAVAGELSRGELSEVALPGLPAKRKFWLVTMRRTTLSTSASALVELLGA
jgi:DNA-binding transcriptional LysR family regulator